MTLNTYQKTGDSGGTRDVSPLLTTSTHCLASEDPVLVHFSLNLTFDSGPVHLPSPAQTWAGGVGRRLGSTSSHTPFLGPGREGADSDSVPWAAGENHRESSAGESQEKPGPLTSGARASVPSFPPRFLVALGAAWRRLSPTSKLHHTPPTTTHHHPGPLLDLGVHRVGQSAFWGRHPEQKPPGPSGAMWQVVRSHRYSECGFEQSYWEWGVCFGSMTHLGQLPKQGPDQSCRFIFNSRTFPTKEAHRFMFSGACLSLWPD